MNASKNWFTRLRQGLSRSSTKLHAPLKALFKKQTLSSEDLEEIEEILLQSDMGFQTASALTQALLRETKQHPHSPEEWMTFLASEIENRLALYAKPLLPNFSHKPWICLMVGVNGNGKTTTAGKLAAQWIKQGLKVGLVAGDTFRAAAVEQLSIWAERSGAHFFSGQTEEDAASLVFKSLEEARHKKLDILIIDTAGRLQNKTHLMDELAKTVRVLQKQDPTAPHATLLVLDAITGQNALSQVELFQKAIPLSGLIVTKIDGSAKGGILLDLVDRFALPIYALGVGEQIEDLQPFNADSFARGLVGIEK